MVLIHLTAFVGIQHPVQGLTTSPCTYSGTDWRSTWALKTCFLYSKHKVSYTRGLWFCKVQMIRRHKGLLDFALLFASLFDTLEVFNFEVLPLSIFRIFWCNTLLLLVRSVEIVLLAYVNAWIRQLEIVTWNVLFRCLQILWKLGPLLISCIESTQAASYV